MVALAMAALVAAVGVPIFAEWSQNVRIRSTAESMMAGLQLARSEATSRNALVRFQLTSSLDDGCVLDESSRNWVIDMVDASDLNDSVEGKCSLDLSDTVQPAMLHKRGAGEVSGQVGMQTGGVNSIVFNGLGRLQAGSAAAQLDFFGASLAECRVMGGSTGQTCLRILVSTTGMLRMCDPAKSAGDPQSC